MLYDCSKILKDEEVTALFLSPRFGAEDRFGKLAELFAAELAPAEQYGGYLPIQSKRLRSLKHIVCATKEFEEGVIRFRDLPVMGAGAYSFVPCAASHSSLVVEMQAANEVRELSI